MTARKKQITDKITRQLNNVIERNIRTIIQLRVKAARERACNPVLPTRSPLFRAHGLRLCALVWFGAWILLNDGRSGVRPFDHFPTDS